MSLYRVDDGEHAYPDARNDQAEQDQTKAREQEEMARTLTRRGHLLLLSKRESRASKVALHDTPVSLLFHSRYPTISHVTYLPTWTPPRTATSTETCLTGPAPKAPAPGTQTRYARRH